MKRVDILPTALLFLSLSLFPLSAQFGPGGRGGANGGIFSTASPAAPGRVVTVGGRLGPVRKIIHTSQGRRDG